MLLQIREQFSRVTESEYTDELCFRNGTQYDLRRRVEIVERWRASEESEKKEQRKREERLRK